MQDGNRFVLNQLPFARHVVILGRNHHSVFWVNCSCREAKKYFSCLLKKKKSFSLTGFFNRCGVEGAAKIAEPLPKAQFDQYQYDDKEEAVDGEESDHPPDAETFPT